jgi:predicted nucleic-acid-binding protein
MENKLLDTNILVRLFMQDHQTHYKESFNIFNNAIKKGYLLLISTEILLELEYVLRSIYKVDRQGIAKDFESLAETNCVSFLEDDIVRRAIKVYPLVNVDMVDVVIFVRSQILGLEIKTFDKDFVKIKKVYDSFE